MGTIFENKIIRYIFVSVILLGSMCLIGLLSFNVIHDDSSGDDLKNAWALVIPGTTSFFILLILAGHFTGIRQIEDKNRVRILILILAVIIFVTIGVGVADYHYNKLEKQDLKDKINDARLIVSEIQMLIEDKEDGGETLSDCDMINSYHESADEILNIINDLMSEIPDIEEYIREKGSEDEIREFERIQSRIQSEYEIIQRDYDAINTEACGAEPKCESCIENSALSVSAPSSVADIENFTSDFDSNTLSSVSACGGLSQECSSDSECSDLLIQQYRIVNDGSGFPDNANLDNLYNCYCNNIPEGMNPCSVLEEPSVEEEEVCGQDNQVCQNALEITTVAGEIVEDFGELEAVASEVTPWGDIDEYLQEDNQSGCLPNPDLDRDQNSNNMEACLKKYFVSGNYSDVSSETAPVPFRDVCNTDLNTEARKNMIISGGPNNKNKYKYQYMVRSREQSDIDDELNNYCTGICSMDEPNIEDRCETTNSRTRRSLNDFNNLISNMKTCSEEGATVDTDDDGTPDACDTDIFTSGGMYSIFNDLMITS